MVTCDICGKLRDKNMVGSNFPSTKYGKINICYYCTRKINLPLNCDYKFKGCNDYDRRTIIAVDSYITRNI